MSRMILLSVLTVWASASAAPVSLHNDIYNDLFRNLPDNISYTGPVANASFVSTQGLTPAYLLYNIHLKRYLRAGTSSLGPNQMYSGTLQPTDVHNQYLFKFYRYNDPAGAPQCQGEKTCTKIQSLHTGYWWTTGIKKAGHINIAGRGGYHNRDYADTLTCSTKFLPPTGNENKYYEITSPPYTLIARSPGINPQHQPDPEPLHKLVGMNPRNQYTKAGGLDQVIAADDPFFAARSIFKQPAIIFRSWILIPAFSDVRGYWQQVDSLQTPDDTATVEHSIDKAFANGTQDSTTETFGYEIESGYSYGGASVSTKIYGSTAKTASESVMQTFASSDKSTITKKCGALCGNGTHPVLVYVWQWVMEGSLTKGQQNMKVRGQVYTLVQSVDPNTKKQLSPQCPFGLCRGVNCQKPCRTGSP